MVGALIEKFFYEQNSSCSGIENERSLQLELGCFFRQLAHPVKFEVGMKLSPNESPLRKQKRYLDLLVGQGENLTAVELKVPLQGRHPETMYDFCADIAFLEEIVLAGYAKHGVAVLLTNDKTFWDDSGRGSRIHDYFRKPGELVCGSIVKPTGKNDSNVFLKNTYALAELWKKTGNETLMVNSKILIVHIPPVNRKQRVV